MNINEHKGVKNFIKIYKENEEFRNLVSDYISIKTQIQTAHQSISYFRGDIELTAYLKERDLVRRETHIKILEMLGCKNATKRNCLGICSDCMQFVFELYINKDFFIE